MPVQRQFPDTNIDELPTGVRTVMGVATSVTAFVGYTSRGPEHTAVRCRSSEDYERRFGGLEQESELAFAVQQFFRNGGREAVVVRVPRVGATRAAATLFDAAPEEGTTPRMGLVLEASGSGAWGNSLSVAVDHDEAIDDSSFNLTVSDVARGTLEQFTGLSVDPTSRRNAVAVLNDAEHGSVLVRARVGTADAARPVTPHDPIALSQGAEGTALPGTDELVGSKTAFTGMQALHHVDQFNLLCVPDATRAEPGTPQRLAEGLDHDVLVAAAYALCVERRAMLLVDPPPDVADPDRAARWITTLPTKGPDAIALFPRVHVADPTDALRVRTVAPSGSVAGMYARIDATRGVWTAPAGTEARLVGVSDVVHGLTDDQLGALNRLGLCCLRSIRDVGTVCWGARTTDGADGRGSEWKYVPVRRLALFLEESLGRGTQWAVFEPNDEPLWAQLRLSVSEFLHGLFRQGAFAGVKPDQAFFVTCDATTTTRGDIDRGVVNLLVGFAPLRPAEFVVLRIQQTAGQPR